MCANVLNLIGFSMWCIAVNAFEYGIYHKGEYEFKYDWNKLKKKKKKYWNGLFEYAGLTMFK